MLVYDAHAQVLQHLQTGQLVLGSRCNAQTVHQLHFESKVLQLQLAITTLSGMLHSTCWHHSCQHQQQSGQRYEFVSLGMKNDVMSGIDHATP
jgi:hypothetical protein